MQCPYVHPVISFWVFYNPQWSVHAFRSCEIDFDFKLTISNTASDHQSLILYLLYIWRIDYLYVSYTDIQMAH